MNICYCQIEIRTYDMGKPSYDDRRTLTIVALDEDDNPPRFSRIKYPLPYKVAVEEGRKNIFVANLDLAEDRDMGNNSRICYYLVGKCYHILSYLQSKIIMYEDKYCYA